jgi:predicted amidohydrolase YtcJ
MGEEQKVSRVDAVRAMTLGGAALTFEEEMKGTLEKGKLADLVVLDEDILTCEPERIRDMGIVLTMVGGKISYRRNR